MLESKEDVRKLTQEQRDALLLACLDALSSEACDIRDEISTLDRMTSGNWMHKISFIKARAQSRKETLDRIAETADINYENFSSSDIYDDFTEAFTLI